MTVLARSHREIPSPKQLPAAEYQSDDRPQVAATSTSREHRSNDAEHDGDPSEKGREGQREEEQPCGGGIDHHAKREDENDGQDADG
ncbi:MAG: hypothetical protein IJG47_08530 [Microbacterium sp.]|nr:hypothetical protein [Microbacterium sp.]